MASSLQPPEGVSADQWVMSKFGPDLKSFTILRAEFDVLKEEASKVAVKDKAFPLQLLSDPQARILSNRAYEILGYKGRRYIASREPTESCVIDFWLMIDQEQVLAIVMLNGLEMVSDPKHETVQYWPMVVDEVKQFGPCKVKLIWSKLKQSSEDTASHSQEDTASYTYRLSKLSFIGPSSPEPKTIMHICHYKWPDCKLPQPSVLPNMAKTNALQLVDVIRKELRSLPVESAVVVHCRGGIGRTGTAIVADICAARLLNSGKADVLETVRMVRRQRHLAVLNVWQYGYLNVVLAQLALEHLSKQLKKVRQSPDTEAATVSAIEKCWREIEEDLAKH